MARGGPVEHTASQRDLDNIIIVTHYGQTNLTERNGGPFAYTMRSTRGVVVPSINSDSKHTPCERVQNVEWPANRSIFFSFAGNMGNPVDTVYAQGVRPLVKQAMSGVPGAVFTNSARGEDFLKLYRDSIFCLAPSGYGYGNRITFAMLCGCIPVIIQDGVRQSFDDVLPYWEFSVRVPQRDIARLPDILSRIPQHVVERMRHSVWLHHRNFCWSSTPGGSPEARAYHATLESLSRKVYQGTFASS